MRIYRPNLVNLLHVAWRSIQLGSDSTRQHKSCTLGRSALKDTITEGSVSQHSQPCKVPKTSIYSPTSVPSLSSLDSLHLLQVKKQPPPPVPKFADRFCSRFK